MNHLSSESLPAGQHGNPRQPRPRLSKREFLASSGRLALGAGLAGVFLPSQAAERRKPLTVAVRDVHLKETGQPDCWSALKELGATGVEVGVNETLECPSLHHPLKKYALATLEEIKTLQEDLAAHGATVTAFCMNNRLDERLEAEIAWAKRLVAAARPLGVSVIRIDVVPRQVAPDQFLPFAIKACKELCAVAEGTPVRFGIENHGRITNDPAFLEKLFDGVGSARLGLTLDAMNFYWFGHPLGDLYGIYRKLASRTFHTHCKNLRYPEAKRNVRRPMGWEYSKYAAPLDEGDIDYRVVADILRRANYTGDLCLENECLGRFPKSEQAQVLKREVALLTRLSL